MVVTCINTTVVIIMKGLFSKEGRRVWSCRAGGVVHCDQKLVGPIRSSRVVRAKVGKAGVADVVTFIARGLWHHEIRCLGVHDSAYN